MILILEGLHETSSAAKPSSSFGHMITVFSCCLPFVQDRALLSTHDIAGAALVNDNQQQRLLGNIDDRQVFRNATVSKCLAFSDECYEVSVRVSKKLLHKEVSPTLVHFTCATLYKAPSPDEEFCTCLLPLPRRLLFEEWQTFDNYSTELYNAVVALFEELTSAATAANCTVSDVSKTRFSILGSRRL